MEGQIASPKLQNCVRRPPRRSETKGKLDSMLQTDERTLDLSIQNSSNSGDLNTWVMLAYKTHYSTEKEKSNAGSSNCQIWIKQNQIKSRK